MTNKIIFSIIITLAMLGTALGRHRKEIDALVHPPSSFMQMDWDLTHYKPYKVSP